MINYKLFKENGLTPKSIKKNKSTYLLETIDNKKYIIKEKNNELNDKFDYLRSRNFKYFPNKFTLSNYDIYEYLDNTNIYEEERLEDIIDLISILHTKTTRYKNIDIDDYKAIYEEIDKRIEDLYIYYSELNDLIDTEIYMSPSKYLLVVNISKVYSALDFCKDQLEEWYDLVKENQSQRVAYIHNNLELDHLIRKDNPYLISWNNSKTDLPIYDLYDLYIKYYNKTDFSLLLKKYQKRYPLKKEELKLFFIKISIPLKIEFSSNEYNNTREVNKLLKYLTKGDELISPYYIEAKS